MAALFSDFLATLPSCNHAGAALSRNAATIIMTALSLFVSANSAGSPWIEPGDERTRHHIQALSDAGVLRSPVNSWPLMWSNIKNDLDTVQPQDLDEAQLWSYHYLKHGLRKAMRRSYVEQSVRFGNQVVAISDFATDAQERYQTSLAVGYTGDRIAFKLKASYAHEPLDGHSYRADGSYFNYLIGNWAVGVGEIDRWWGPGWESSLILSHNARPSPSIYLQRNAATPFATPWLSWLGPWQMTTFMSQLESKRAIPNTKLWGMRINIKPFRRFELGLSRTAQWGGTGRPNDIDTFINLVLGKDNLDDFEADDTHDRTEEPGNQLAGIDWRWGYALGSTTGSVYGQFIGEDEAGGMPSRSIGMAGIEMNRLIGDIHTRISLEAQNTTVYFYDSDKRRGDVAYEHSIYQSGYRYYGRPIGASTDNDSESLTFRSQWYFRSGHNINMSVGHHRINLDDDGKSPPGGSVFGRNEKNTYRTQVTYTAPVGDDFLLQLSAFHYSESVIYNSIELDTGGFVSVRAYW